MDIRENNHKSKAPRCSNVHKIIYIIGKWSEKFNNVKNFRYKHKDWSKRAVLSANVPI